MNHNDHVRLIAPAFALPVSGLRSPDLVWADFGAGEGAFTLALRDLAGPESEIYAIDRNRSALESLRRSMHRHFPNTSLHLLVGDIRQPPDLPRLDGIVAANSLHYVEANRQAATLQRWTSLLKPDGRIVLVEYDLRRPNSWVPYPVSFDRLGALARDAGLPAPIWLGSHPSYDCDIYSAMIVP